MEAIDFASHWNNAYRGKDITKLGWYEDISTPSLDIIKEINLNKEDPILIIGCGTTTLIDSLLDKKFTNIIATDISEEAIKILEERIGEDNKSITYIIDDISDPSKLNKQKQVSVWHDRALLHFLSDLEQKEQYLKLMNKLVKVGGFVIIAAFALEGAAKCSGLDVNRYSPEMLIELLGKDYKLLKSFDHLYTKSNGDTRPYIYTVFNRIN